MKRTYHKHFKRGIILFLALCFFGLHFIAPRFITEIRNPLAQVFKKEQSKTQENTFEAKGLKGKTIEFKSFDNLNLSSYLSYSNLAETKGTIILLHGIRSNKESFAGLCKTLSNLGYNSVALDSRAHGFSEGTHCTFGVNEKFDVSTLIDVLAEKENITQNIGVWGKSLGGAIGLQALGHDKRIKFGIIESTFSSFNAIVNDYFKLHLGFNFEPLTNYLVRRAGKIAEFNPEEAFPAKYCKNIDQPILISHGAMDKRIDIKYAKINYKNIASKSKTLIEIPLANHSNVWQKGGQDYFLSIKSFLNENAIKSDVKTQITAQQETINTLNTRSKS
ncbi:MAG: hypothetical protein BM564_01760 [Bacteroidetes bacterium MedPE-SWsnd-G2]|nr:MAG: hypothetical protein BM564_01760 [Bacteroidetes bacterium MedPE-SWsnd-G2]